jgi:HEAT repeat protein
VTRRVRSFGAARRATVQISDREGTHHGQGLLLDIEGEGAVVLTCHHIIAQLPPDAVYVRLPGEDGKLGAPHLATYDEDRSRPRADAVVLHVEGVHLSERPLLHELDPSEYSGNLDAIGLTYLAPTTFSATVSASTPIEMDVPTLDARLPSGSKYVIPSAFRLANPTDAIKGISGAVVVCNAGVLGLAQSARKAEQVLQREVYLMPLRVWAEGWDALSDLIEPFVGEAEDPYDYARQDYLRAIRIFSTDTPYLTLDGLLGGAKRALHEVYVPLLARSAGVPSSDKPSEGEEEGKEKVKEEEERDKHAGDGKTESEEDARLSEGQTEQRAVKPSTVTLTDILHAAGKHDGYQNVLLQGAAGFGKSTALRHIRAHAWSQPHLLGLSRPHLPIVIRLQFMAEDRGASIDEWLLNGLRRAGDLALERTPPAGFFSEWSARENAPWLLLLDGLDEVAAERRDGVLRWVKVLLQGLEGRHLVVMTSRPANDSAYQELASEFAVYDVLPFDEGQQVDFATRWFPEAADDFLAKVRRLSAGSVFREQLTPTPLLLTIAAAIYRRDGDLPESGEVELYGKFIDILFEEAGRRGLFDELKDGVSDVARGGLERLALAMTERPTENTLAALTQVSAKFLKDELRWGATRAEARGAQFAEVMGRRTGVLYRKGDSFHWVHPTIREHLAAQALHRQLRNSGNDYTTVIGERLLEQRWYDVLWTLTFMHQDRQALVRWMSREARDNFDADAALLAYDCWKDSEPAVREALKSDIVGALAGGLGDSQSGLSPRGKLLRHLTRMGVDVTEQLLALLEEHNGLQRRLLPEWDDEENHPDIYTEPGSRIYAGFQLRLNIIKVLGDIGDERAVEPLISLLGEKDRTDSFRRDIAWGAQRALRCIGTAAVGPLLARIGDTTLRTKTRIDCLTALGEVGIRADTVTPVLESSLREGLGGDAELLARALWEARRLRDDAHQAHAISALASDDMYVVAEAAEYLKLMPDPSGFDALDSAFTKWLSKSDDFFVQMWTLRRLAAALLATGKPKAKKTILHFIKSSLEDRGKLPPDDAVQTGDEVRLPELPRLLLRELIRQLNLPEPGIIVDDLVTRLGAVWRPVQTGQLVNATLESGIDAVSGGSFAGKLIDICVGSTQEREGQRPSLREYLNREKVLRLMAKCQVPDFIAQAERLLVGAKFWMVSRISDALWVVGDPSAEAALIAALDNFVRPTMQADRSMPEEYDILRALGTCSTERGAQAVMSYVRENPNLSIYLPGEVLCPLVRHRVLDVDTLSRMALDMTGTHEFVRRACVLALGYLNAPQFTPVFLKVVESETDEQARAYAATFLGWAKTERVKVVKALQDVLTTTERTFLATRAAQALVRLKSRDSLRVIERAAGRFRSVGPASGLLRAAARFRERSTLELLKNLPVRAQPHSYQHTEADIIGAFGEFYQADASARARVDAELERAGRNFDSGRQRAAVWVLARRNPDWLLQRTTELYDEDRLEPSACTAVINCMPRLSKYKKVDKARVVGLMKRLLCEAELSIRESAGESLRFVAAPVRHRIYDELRGMRNDWARACAVYSLAFWDSEESVIKDAHFDASPVVRRLASTAAGIRSKRRALRQVAKTFRTTGGLERLSAYYSLLEQATESLVDTLYRDVKEDHSTRVYLREIGGEVERRVKEERKKRAQEEGEQICEKVRHVVFT